MAKTNSHLIESNFIQQKFHGKTTIESAWAYLYFQKSGIAQDIIHHLKYNNCPQIGVEMGSRYGAEIRDVVKRCSIDFIVPVPLHYKKQKIRGYNQSEMLAEGLSKSLDLPLINALKRNVATTSQTSKTRIQRWINVENIFELIDNSVSDKNILLVDDVITTGSTLEACAQTLIDHGCKVHIATLAAAK